MSAAEMMAEHYQRQVEEKVTERALLLGISESWSKLAEFYRAKGQANSALQCSEAAESLRETATRGDS